VSESTGVELDTIENTRFLGPEFLVWMWFKSELFGSELELDGYGQIELWLDSQLVLESQIDSRGEATGDFAGGGGGGAAAHRVRSGAEDRGRVGRGVADRCRR